jgi:D-lyxose ketol-isomerase
VVSGCASRSSIIDSRPAILLSFWGEGGDVLVGEVSTVNNDETDNIFRDPVSRFASIDEDEPPLHLLVSDYNKWLGTESSV